MHVDENIIKELGGGFLDTISDNSYIESLEATLGEGNSDLLADGIHITPEETTVNQLQFPTNDTAISHLNIFYTEPVQQPFEATQRSRRKRKYSELRLKIIGGFL